MAPSGSGGRRGGPGPCSARALTPRAWRGTFWSQTGGSPAGFYLFYYFSLNICCQTLYRSKLLHSTTSHLLFRIGRIRRVEVKSKHRRAGKAPRCIARQMGYDTVHNLIIKNIYMYISIM
uniref:Uncharacterized protein n=1 Tax=Anser brachyrhynchus TaxID=132585 RepID=A0A8B9BTS2_9AVES